MSNYSRKRRNRIASDIQKKGKGIHDIGTFQESSKEKKSAKAAAMKIKTIAGRLARDLSRKMNDNQWANYADLFAIFSRILEQTKNSKNKIYNIHEPGVKCIAKGKEHKPYEFGNKSSIAKTKEGIIVGAIAFKENVFDGDTLAPQLDQIERLVGNRPKTGITDRRYRGRKQVGTTEIIIPTPVSGQYQKEKQRRRFRTQAGIEPVIGHVKHDHRMERNYLKGNIGDAINTMLAVAAFNIKKFLNGVKKSGKKFFDYIFLPVWVLLQKFLCSKLYYSNLNFLTVNGALIKTPF